MNLLSILLMAGPNGQSSGTSSIIMMVLLIFVFYFFMIRPQMKRQKEEKKFRDGLKKGDLVVVLGGIHGKVQEVKETTLIVEVANNVNITVEKASVIGATPSK